MRIKMYENFTSNVPTGEGATQSARGTINDIVKKRVSFIKKFRSDVEDIFVELLDDHFLVDVNVTNNNNRNSGYFRCDISIYKDVERGDQPREFNFIDIKENVMMFESYINEYEYENLNYNLPGVVKDLDSASGNYVKIGVWIKL
jgi:hypothetical protein